MEHRGTKEAAESVLRELPSVVGAFVREDAYGYPREVHLLIAAGPKPRHFALDVKTLLEERLGIPIDQRIISIAQLASEPSRGAEAGEAPPSAAGTGVADARSPESAPRSARRALARALPCARVRFVTALTEVSDARVTVRVRLEWEDREYEGTATELEAGSGRVRAGAVALLRAANQICGEHGRFELESASLVRVMERDYALVGAIATSPYLGRRPVEIVGAQPVEESTETAATLATLKSLNRLLGWITRLGEGVVVPMRAARR
jgi:hypothetical protein